MLNDTVNLFNYRQCIRRIPVFYVGRFSLVHSCLNTSHSHCFGSIITTGLESPFQVLMSALLERMGKNGNVCSDYKEMME